MRRRGKGIVRLTNRERDVLPFLKTSLGFKQIADKLNVSLNTAKQHSQRIYRKFGVRDRWELVAKLESSTMPIQGLETRIAELEYRLQLIAEVICTGTKSDFRKLTQ